MLDTVLKKLASSIRADRKAISATADNTSNDSAIYQKVARRTNEWLAANYFVSAQAGLEDLSKSVTVDGNVVLSDSLTGPKLMQFVDAFNLDHLSSSMAQVELARESLAVNVAAAVVDSQNNLTAAQFVQSVAADDRTMSLSMLTGPYAYDTIASHPRLALESFGQDSDRLTSDARLNINLTIMKLYKSLADRIFPRIAQESNTVTLKIPQIDLYDLKKSQDAKADVRWGNHIIPMPVLYRQPGPASTAPKEVIPLPENDVDEELLWNGTSNLLINKQVNLLDLSMQPGQVGSDWTDLISEGGRINHGIIRVVYSPAGGPVKTEYFKVPVSYTSTSTFTGVQNGRQATDRSANASVSYSLVKNSTRTTTGALSEIAAVFATTTRIVVDVNINANLNLQTHFAQASGFATAKLKTINNVDLTPTENTAFGLITVDLVAWSPKLWWSEENLRHTTTAARITYKPMQWLIPVGRSVILDYSLQSGEAPDDVVAAINNINAIGNTERHLAVVESKLREFYERLEVEREIGLSLRESQLAQEVAAGSRCFPTVYLDTLDFDVDNPQGPQIQVLREAERSAELKARTTTRLKTLLANLQQQSIYGSSLDADEKPAFKVITSTQIRALLMGISQYHNVYDDKRAPEKEANLSLVLDDGTRLDIYSTDFDSFQNKLLIFPIRDNEPASVLSTATIYDRGQFTAQYTPINVGGGVNKRIVVNTREFPFFTNPLGLIIEVKNLEAQLYGYKLPVTLGL